MTRVVEYVSLIKRKRSKAYSSSFVAYSVYGTPAKMPPLVQLHPTRPTESSLRQSRHCVARYVRPVAPVGLRSVLTADGALSATHPAGSAAAVSPLARRRRH